MKSLSSKYFTLKREESNKQIPFVDNVPTRAMNRKLCCCCHKNSDTTVISRMREYFHIILRKKENSLCVAKGQKVYHFSHALQSGTKVGKKEG